MKKHNDMNTIKSIITVFFALMLFCSAQAQQNNGSNHWWGKDTVKVEKFADNSQVVEIGSMEDSQDKSYEWSGPNIVGDPKKPVVTVNPREMENEYNVRRVSKCGVEEARVLVTLIDSITIVNVTPLYQCYTEGEPIKPEDFIIETSPEGYGNKATVWPDVAHEGQPVVLTIRYNGHTSDYTVDNLKVFNDNSSSDVSVDTDPNELTQIKDKIQKARDLLEQAQEVSGLIESISPDAGPGCKPSFTGFGSSDGVESGFSMLAPKFFRACCNHDSVTAFQVFSPTMTFSANIDCQFPIPNLSFPYVGGVYVIFGAGMGVTAGPISVVFRGKCSDMFIEFKLFASAYGGVRVLVINDKFFKADLKLQGEANTSVLWKVGDELRWGGVNFSVGIGGEITLFSLATEKFGPFNIIETTLFK